MTTHKTCRTCGQLLPVSEFGAFKRAPDGLRYDCKPCNNRKSKEWYEANKERRCEKSKAWQAANPGKTRQYQQKYQSKNAKVKAVKSLANYHANKDLWRSRNKHFYATHQAWNNAKRAKYKASKLRATPPWANEFFVGEAYRLARLRTKMLGFPWHVDHIVPLRSKKVCGLHTHDNLRVIPGAENSSKGNRHWPDMPRG